MAGSDGCIVFVVKVILIKIFCVPFLIVQVTKCVWSYINMYKYTPLCVIRKFQSKRNNIKDKSVLAMLCSYLNIISKGKSYLFLGRLFNI